MPLLHRTFLGSSLAAATAVLLALGSATAAPSEAAPTANAWPLVITEITPDNVGYDNFEFFEVHNTTNAAIDLGPQGVHFSYIFENSDVRTKDVALTVPAQTTIAAGGTTVFWLNYATTTVDTSKFTEADFRAHFPASASAGEYPVVRVTGQAGMANTGSRGIRATDSLGASLSWAYYPDGSVATDQAIDFAIPASGSTKALTPFRTLVAPTPGIVDPAALVGSGDTDPTPPPELPQDPTLTGAALQVTELLPDSANIAGADAYEFIEVYNATNRTVDFSDYSLEYLYPLDDLSNSQTTLWPSTTRAATIAAGKTLVFWVRNGSNAALTEADFNRKFGSSLVLGTNLLEIESAGMANSAARGIAITTNTGFHLNTAYYNLKGADNVTADKGIQYAFDPAHTAVQVLAGEAAASPGSVTTNQVPTKLLDVPADTVAPVVLDTTASTIDPAAKFPIAATVTDDVQVRTATLRVRGSIDDDFRSINLVADAHGDYGYTIPAVDLTGLRWLDYYFVASDGSNTTTTETTHLTVEGADDSPVRLNLTEGQFVSGDVRVSAATNAATDAATLAIDGSPAQTTRSLESAPQFVFEAGGVNVFFKNGVLIGTDVLRIFDDGIPTGYDTIATPVPLKYVTQGNQLVVSVYAGTKAAPEIDPDENNDNFTIKNLRLVLPDGRVIRPIGYTDPTKVINMGDSSGALDFYDATFDLPASAFTAVTNTWQTATTVDGAHTISASDGRNAITRTAHVDNTVPTLTTTVENGIEYRGPFVIAATAADTGSGLDTVTATLDGWKIALPYSTSSVTLPSGAHALELRARDKLGNENVTSVAFTTPDEQPGTELVSPIDGAIIDTTAIDLKATATDPSGDNLNVSFEQAYALNPSAAAVQSYAGETAIADSTDRAQKHLLSGADLANMATTDGIATTASSSAAFPYELFELAIPADAGADFQARLNWTGSANADAKVLMYVFNTATNSWEEVDRYVTTVGAPTDFSLAALVPAADHVANQKVTVLVQHSEGFAGADLSDRTSTVTPFNPGATPRSDFDFTFGWETDTQYYNDTHPEHQLAIQNFFLKNRADLNLQYVFHTGDVVDNSLDEHQWVNADGAYKLFDDAKLPYGIVAGNHDVGHKEDDYTQFSKYFGEKRYNQNPWYGGSHEDNRGHYDLISSGGIDFMVVYMGWDPGDAQLAWMNEVIGQYPERTVILDMHEYILTTGGLGPIPQRITDEVIATNPNVKMVFSGHYHDAFTRIDSYDDNGDGTPDRKVYAMLFDFQGLPEGGLAYLRLVHFDNASANLTVRTYSPYLDDFDSDDPTLDLEHQEFSVAYADLGITPKVKTLSTDSFTADILTTNTIANFADVVSGTPLTANWSNLALGAHGWYVASTDPFGASDFSPVRTLTVEAPVVVPGEPETPANPGTPTVPAGEQGSTPIDESLLVEEARHGVDAPGTVAPGATFSVAVPGHAGETVRVWLHSTPILLGTVRVAANGSASVTLPADAPTGNHKIVVQAIDGSLVGWDTVRVAATNAGALAATGADVTGWLVVALGLIVLGIAFGTLRKRRSGALRLG